MSAPPNPNPNPDLGIDPVRDTEPRAEPHVEPDVYATNSDMDPVDVDLVDATDSEKPSAPVRKVDPMQGMKLEAILHELVAYFGWEEMGYRINIRCFNEDPSIGSSLKFLRKTPWARTKVDTLFLTMRAEQSEKLEQT